MVGGDKGKGVSGKGVKSQNDKYSVTGALHASQNKGSQLKGCKDRHPHCHVPWIPSQEVRILLFL